MSGLQRLRAYWRSPHHAWTALGTLGLGLASAQVPVLILGAAAYALSWVFLPDSRWFRRWAERRFSPLSGLPSTTDFEQERTRVYMQLTPAGRRSYDALAKLVEEIRHGSGGPDSPHAGRLSQIAWTYLRLLSSKEALRHFCAKEQSEVIRGELEAVAEELRQLEIRAREAAERGDAVEAGATEQLLQSKQGRHTSLERHYEQVRKAESDLDLTVAEMERLYDAVRLMRADLMARRDPDALGAEIDRTTAHFHRTHDWLRGLEEEWEHPTPELPEDIAAHLSSRLK